MEIVAETLEKHGVEKGVLVYITPGGYISFDPHDSKWGMLKLNKKSKPEIRYEYREVVE